MWVGTTIQSNVRALSAPMLRLTMFGVALAGLFMALAVPGAYGERATLFAGAYWAARLLLGLVLFSGSGRFHINPFMVSMCLSGPLLLVGALVGGSAREAIWERPPSSTC